MNKKQKAAKRKLRHSRMVNRMRQKTTIIGGRFCVGTVLAIKYVKVSDNIFRKKPIPYVFFWDNVVGRSRVTIYESLELGWFCMEAKIGHEDVVWSTRIEESVVREVMKP